MEPTNDKFKTRFKQRVYIFSIEIVKAVDSVDLKRVSDQVIAKQLIRSGTSVTANYVEASSASSDKDFTRFFNYSLKSAKETLFWLSLLKDTGKLKSEIADSLISECSEIAKVLAKSILTLKSRS